MRSRFAALQDILVEYLSAYTRNIGISHFSHFPCLRWYTVQQLILPWVARCGCLRYRRVVPGVNQPGCGVEPVSVGEASCVVGDAAPTTLRSRSVDHTTEMGWMGCVLCCLKNFNHTPAATPLTKSITGVSFSSQYFGCCSSMPMFFFSVWNK